MESHLGRLGRRLAWTGLPGVERTLRRIFPTWPASFFSTASRQTTRQGQCGFGQFLRRAKWFRRSRTKALSLNSSASSSVASGCLLFMAMSLPAYNSLSRPSCHSIRYACPVLTFPACSTCSILIQNALFGKHNSCNQTNDPIPICVALATVRLRTAKSSPGTCQASAPSGAAWRTSGKALRGASVGVR